MHLSQRIVSLSIIGSDRCDFGTTGQHGTLPAHPVARWAVNAQERVRNSGLKLVHDGTVAGPFPYPLLATSP